MDLKLWYYIPLSPEYLINLQHPITQTASGENSAFLCCFFIKGIKNGCPCIVEIRGTQGCALVGDPARAVGECRDVAKAQP